MSPSASLSTRIAFVAELARRLHQYGTASQRLEAAVTAVAEKLGMVCQVLATPTGITLALAEAAHADDPLSLHTMIVRVDPGEVHLKLLARVDDIADDVSSGKLDLAEGFRQLRALRAELSPRGKAITVLAHGLASAGVAGLLNTSVLDVAAAAGIGMVIGTLSLLSQGRHHVQAAFEAIAALAATLMAAAFGHYVAPLNTQSVVLASLIVLLPGLMLTTAVAEVASQQLSAGTARFAGAMATLLKLTFGAVAGTQIAFLFGWEGSVTLLPSVPGWAHWVALLGASYAFAVLFRAGRRDYPLVMAAAWLGYLSAYVGRLQFGPEFAVFLGGLVVGATSNAYARWASRPGALIRVPGIILLVPGSVGFRSLSFVFEHDVFLGVDTTFHLIAILASLVAGLLFGNLLIPPRRSL
ncbi:MAG TPA: threonine/serine exporter family protein [Xanthomonadaceae bacterium]|nr:threonine/serine exporter family protein [Xanthomonadaceae bacterium]